jgi:hypothetical protein
VLEGGARDRCAVGERAVESRLEPGSALRQRLDRQREPVAEWVAGRQVELEAARLAPDREHARRVEPDRLGLGRLVVAEVGVAHDRLAQVEREAERPVAGAAVGRPRGRRGDRAQDVAVGVVHELDRERLVRDANGERAGIERVGGRAGRRREGGQQDEREGQRLHERGIFAQGRRFRAGWGPGSYCAMADDITQITVGELVRDAVTLVDPDGVDSEARSLELAYEDDDRVAVGLEGLREELDSTIEGLDPDHDSAPAEVAAAVAFYLSTKPAGGSDGEATIREAVRVHWGDSPPEHVSAWLAAQGVEA